MKLVNFWVFVLSVIVLAGVWSVAITVWPGPKVYPAHVHKTLYVDRYLDDDTFEAISYAAIRWSVGTNHIIDYDVVRMPITDHKEIADPEASIVIVGVSPEYPDVIQSDTENGESTLGIYKERCTALPVIELVLDRILDPDTLEMVLMHEMGHSVGLKHNEGMDGVGTLMYPDVMLGADFITVTDRENFCKLYNCDPKELQYEEEPLHLR